MSVFRDIQAALREGLDELLNAGTTRDGIDEVTELLENDLQEARSEADVAREDERKIRERIDRERQDAEALKARAQRAVDDDDEERGRDLLRRRHRCLRGVELLERQWTEHQQLIAELNEHIEQLEDKLHELRLRGDFLRTRERVSALRSRFERYRRDYALDDPPPFEDQDGPAELGGLPELDEPVDDDGDRLPSAEAESRASEPRSRRGEMPRPDEPDEPRLRRQAEDEIDESVYERRPRDFRLERDRLLREIERAQRQPEFESEIDTELARMKRRPGEPDLPPDDQPADDVGEPHDEAGSDS